MYKCKDCEKEFRFPKKTFEKHGLPHAPYEEIWLCPHCGSHSFIKLPEFHCRYCGIKLSDERDYCSTACRKNGEAAYARQAQRREMLDRDPLIIAIREVEEYNRATGKRLSYGEYFAGRR